MAKPAAAKTPPANGTADSALVDELRAWVREQSQMEPVLRAAASGNRQQWYGSVGARLNKYDALGYRLKERFASWGNFARLHCDDLADEYLNASTAANEMARKASSSTATKEKAKTAAKEVRPIMNVPVAKGSGGVDEPEPARPSSSSVHTGATEKAAAGKKAADERAAKDAEEKRKKEAAEKAAAMKKADEKAGKDRAVVEAEEARKAANDKTAKEKAAAVKKTADEKVVQDKATKQTERKAKEAGEKVTAVNEVDEKVAKEKTAKKATTLMETTPKVAVEKKEIQQPSLPNDTVEKAALQALWSASCPRLEYDSFQKVLFDEGYLTINDLRSMNGEAGGKEFNDLVGCLQLKPPEVRRLKEQLFEIIH